MAPLRAGVAAAAVLGSLARAAGSTLLLATNATRTDKAKVTIYYETLCPYCEQLFAVSFRKIWEDPEFQERVDLTLLPFGNARVSSRRELGEGYRFWHPDAPSTIVLCQHGQPECLGNEIQSCAIDLVGTREAAGLVLCMAGKNRQGYGIEASSYSCMEELGMDKDKVKQCLGSRRSTKLTVQHGRLSKKRSLKRKYVPWVVVNGKHEELDEEHDLVKPLCAVLGEPKPQLCSKAAPPPAATSLAKLHKPPDGGDDDAARAKRRAGEVCWQDLGQDEEEEEAAQGSH